MCGGGATKASGGVEAEAASHLPGGASPRGGVDGSEAVTGARAEAVPGAGTEAVPGASSWEASAARRSVDSRTESDDNREVISATSSSKTASSMAKSSISQGEGESTLRGS